jgi:hypothetical protein
MKCESCKIRKIEIELPKNYGLEGGIWDIPEKAEPYKLCFECRDRLLNLALRPLEFFNLSAIHGHSQYLHDDFYDYDTGEATQPETEVVDAEKFPFPTFEEVKSSLHRLIDYSFVQYFTDDTVIETLQKFDKTEVLKLIDEKVKYNKSISYKAYEIVSSVVGKIAKQWAEEQWQNRNARESILVYAELISNCFDLDEAFELITSELNKLDDKTFNENVSALLYLKSEKTLDWLEFNSVRIKNVTSSFGQLAASSQFGWKRCEKWLNTGRPLSLIALDALYLCTMKNYIGQSVWLQKLKPRLTDNTEREAMANKLRDYLKVDSVPRTKDAVGSIIYNLIEAT